MTTIIETIKKYSDNKACIKLLENARWSDGIICPYCKSNKISKKSEKNRTDRYQCQKCHKSFTVTVGTIFHSAKKLPEWFMILTLMLNAKKSLSTYQIARDLGMYQPTVYYITEKIRKAMKTGESELLKGIVEMDETYIGGKPRKRDKDNKRGRGTSKTSVVGIVERDGEVKTEVVNKSNKLSFSTLSGILKRNVDVIKSHLVTDEYRGYSPMGSIVNHSVINHQLAFGNGMVHTNTIEGFWSLIKRAWYGSHHHYSKERVHLYVAETAYKYNNRKNKNVFFDTIKKMLMD